MIEKTCGDFNVKKLFIILLFEADFNSNNKWIGQAVMYQAEQAHLLAEEQYGSQKFKAAIYPCLNKHFFKDLVRFKWRLAALCSNDVKSCYDWITLLAAALCLCCLGSTQSMVASMIKTLHNMEHHIRTKFGDSLSLALRATWHTPIVGIGQGNGAGPHIWVAVSSPLLEIMHADGFYAHMVANISLWDKKLVGFAFVDDMDLCVYGPQVASDMITTNMQSSVDHWEGLLCATGGALVPSKCFWYLIDFWFRNQTWQYISVKEHPGELKICDDHQQRIAIPRLALGDARWTLGVRLAPDSNWES